MKKILTFLLSFLSLAAAGCAQRPVKDPDGHAAWKCYNQGTVVALVQQDDTLQTSTQTFLIPWDALEIEEGSTADQRQEAVNKLSGMFKDLDGVTFTCTPQDAGIEAKIEIDFSRASVSKLEENGLLDEDVIDGKNALASRYMGALEEQGYACSPEE